MALNLDSTGFTLLLCGVSAFIFILLFSALLELKKPRDAGPRTIMKEMIFQRFGTRVGVIDASAEKPEFDVVASKKFLEIIAILPNLES